MIHVYILYSSSIDKHYIGYSTDLDSRIDQHIQKLFKGSYTVRAKDWKIFLTIECDSLSQALKIENHIKAMKSKNYIKNPGLYPEIIEKLKEKYK